MGVHPHLTPIFTADENLRTTDFQDAIETAASFIHVHQDVSGIYVRDLHTPPPDPCFRSLPFPDSIPPRAPRSRFILIRLSSGVYRRSVPPCRAAGRLLLSPLVLLWAVARVRGVSGGGKDRM